MTLQERIFANLDNIPLPLPDSVLLDVLCDLGDEGLPPVEDDDELEARMNAVYDWAKARGVRVRV